MEEGGLKKLLFVAMPFGSKPDPSHRFEIDFDGVYERCIKPATEGAELDVIRADEETLGGIIHKPMYERLLLAEIVIADLTLANANVFYELGIRHAARPRSTILIYAKTSQLPFDVAPIRAVPYELGEGGELSDEEAESLRKTLGERLAEAQESETVDSPLFQLLEGYPGISLPHEVTEAFRDRVRQVSAMTEKIRDSRVLSNEERVPVLREIEEQVGDFAAASQELPLDLLLAYRDASAWGEMVRCVEKMPTELGQVPTVREQLALALNRRNAEGDRERALRILRQLVDEYGPSPETNGLLGRIYKDTWEEAEKAGESGRASAALDAAIAEYGKGFDADPRDYYPGVNLLTLLLRRGTEEDRELVAELQPVVLFAIGRRGGLSSSDYWDVATVLELAVIGGDRELAEKALGRIELLQPQSWERETTAKNLGILAGTAEEGEGDWIEEIRSRLEPGT
ncbi:MAG TPA: TRAFs-binding domain-containing protein [Solirubrobacterales bacterium]|nr:TRAFs-binding domain-containing protein [Solirubrobacterales bacterium]